MGHKCFISFKKEDQNYRNMLDAYFEKVDIINKSLDREIESDNADYIMQVIREQYLEDSTITIFLIGKHSSENDGFDVFRRRKNHFIERELQASLHNRESSPRNGILGIVLPQMYDAVYKGKHFCASCRNEHDIVAINDSTVIREFSANYYTEPHYGCAWSENERYCVLVKWSDFLNSPEYYINLAFDKRNSDIANKIRIRNLR